MPGIEMTRVPGETGAHTVAVLPFLNLSADHDATDFSDGLTEELIFLLSRAANLRVVARTSCFRFKGSSKDVREIGRELGAELLVEGGVRLAGDRLRVTARLVGTADGIELWSDRYDRTLDDVLRVQEDIAVAIAGALRVQAAPRPPDADVEAHNRRALDFFQAAVTRDPAAARAHAGMAETHILMMMHGIAEPLTVMPLASDAVTRALAEDPELAAARSLLPPEADPPAELDVPYTALLVDTGKARVLIDMGAGPLGPETGRLPESLATVGVGLDDIDLVVLSHAHADHSPRSGTAPRVDNALRPRRRADVRTRRKLLHRAAADRCLVFPFHFPRPCVGELVASGLLVLLIGNACRPATSADPATTPLGRAMGGVAEPVEGQLEAYNAHDVDQFLSIDHERIVAPGLPTVEALAIYEVQDGIIRRVWFLPDP